MTSDPHSHEPSVRVVWSTADAFEQLDLELRHHLTGTPLGPVTVVCPDSASSVAARRRAARLDLGGGRRGTCGVTFTTPFALAARCAGDHVVTADTSFVRAAARAVVAGRGDELGLVDHASTRDAAVAAFRELAGVSPHDLGLLRSVARAGAVLQVFSEMSTRLEQSGCDTDVVRSAQRALSKCRVHFGPVIWWCPTPSSWVEEQWMISVMTSGPGVIVLARSGLADSDRPILDMAERCISSPSSMARLDGADATLPTSPDVTVATLTDPDAEVRFVVRRVCEWIRAGIDPAAIAVVAPLDDPYLRSCRRQLTAAGVPNVGPSAEPIRTSVLGRALRRALDLQRHNWSRAAVMELLAGLPNGVDAASRSVVWEQLSREAGIVEGLAEWATGLDELTQRSASALVSEPARQCRRWIERVATALDRVAVAACDERPWTGVADALVALCEVLLAEVVLDDASEVRCVEQAYRSLRRLADLDREGFACSDTDIDDAVEGVLSESRTPSGRIGDGVFVGSPAAVGRMPVVALAIVGAAEGVLAPPSRPDALVPRQVRQSVPGLRRDSGVDAALRGLALAIRGARTTLVTIPSGDLRGRRRFIPSRWLDELIPADAVHVDLLSEATSLLASTVVATPVDAVRRSLLSCDGTALDRWRSLDSREVSDLLGSAAVRRLERAADASLARHRGLVGEWTGQIDMGGRGFPLGVASASALERWAGCGYRYFLADGLGVGHVVDPERRLELGPREVGLVVHEMLEEFGRRRLESDAVAAGAFADAYLDSAPSRFDVGRAASWSVTRRAIRETFVAVADAADEWSRGDGSQLVAVELPFGGVEPCALDTDAGPIEVRGRVDRVDRSSTRVAVADYKIGRTDRWRALHADPFDGGRHLQLGVYAEAIGERLRRAYRADGLRVDYWVVDPRRPADTCERIGVEWTDEHRRRFRSLLATIATAIRSGEFPMVPGTYDSYFRSYDNCRRCPYELVCSSDRDAALDLAEPGEGFRARRRFEVAARPETDGDSR